MKYVPTVEGGALEHYELESPIETVTETAYPRMMIIVRNADNEIVGGTAHIS